MNRTKFFKDHEKKLSEATQAATRALNVYETETHQQARKKALKTIQEQGEAISLIAEILALNCNH